MRAEQGLRPASVPVMTRVRWRRMPGYLRTRRRVRPISLAEERPTHGGCSICTETSRSGAPIGTMRPTMLLPRRKTPSDRNSDPVVSSAAPGSTQLRPRNVALRNVSLTSRLPRTTGSGFESPWTRSPLVPYPPARDPDANDRPLPRPPDASDRSWLNRAVRGRLLFNEICLLQPAADVIAEPRRDP
jgi:hypothetical protein